MIIFATILVICRLPHNQPGTVMRRRPSSRLQPRPQRLRSPATEAWFWLPELLRLTANGADGFPGLQTTSGMEALSPRSKWPSTLKTWEGREEVVVVVAPLAAKP